LEIVSGMDLPLGVYHRIENAKDDKFSTTVAMLKFDDAILKANHHKYGTHTVNHVTYHAWEFHQQRKGLGDTEFERIMVLMLVRDDTKALATGDKDELEEAHIFKSMGTALTGMTDQDTGDDAVTVINAFISSLAPKDHIIGLHIQTNYMQVASGGRGNLDRAPPGTQFNIRLRVPAFP
jgi:hypothetical protein